MGLAFTDRQIAMADWRTIPTAAIGISSRYDDNVTSEKSGPNDLVTSLNPRLALSMEQDITKIETTLTANGEVFSQNSDLNFTSFGSSVNVTHQINPINQVVFTDSVSYTPETPPPSDSVQSEDGGPVTSPITVKRGARISNYGSARLSHRISPLSSVSVSYGNSLTSFRDPSQVNSTTHSANLGLSHHLDRQTTISENYRFSYFLAKGGDDTQNHNFSIGLAHSLSLSWKFSGNIGVNYTVQPDNQTASMSGGLNLSKAVSDQLGMVLSYSANVSTAGGVSNDVVRNQVVNLGFNQVLSRFLSASVSARFGDSRSISGNNVEIDSWDANAGLSYQIGPSISMDANYSHQQQINNGDLGSDFIRNQYSLSVSAEFL